MGRSQELSEFQHGAVIGCHLCNKSSHETSSLLNIPHSTVSGIRTKWKRYGMTATQRRRAIVTTTHLLQDKVPTEGGRYFKQHSQESEDGIRTEKREKGVVDFDSLRTVHADAGSKDEQPIKPHDQEPDLQGRVELANALTCNMSLNSFAIILKNVMQNDNNTYECVFKDSEGKTWNDTRFLIVTNREEPVCGTWRIMVGIAIGIFIAIGVCLYKRHKGKQTDRGSSSEDPEKTSQDTDDSDDAARFFNTDVCGHLKK
ncbi:hypothetical protein Q8A73_012523 [Channa argus]|nr:hypothetical protein Q8A73_012523 [Channa argus]